MTHQRARAMITDGTISNLDDSPTPLEAFELPAGDWAVGVSGGADSVALLSLVRERLANGHRRARFHVVHLDHQTRGKESTEDARFVDSLARQWGFECTVATRADIEPSMPSAATPANPSARFRALRFALFNEVVRDRGLGGVLLAHHADDQAETVVQRLLRGSGVVGLAGISRLTRINGLQVARPLLQFGRSQLRSHLLLRGVEWREDASNASNKYARNRVRKLLSRYEALTHAAIELAAASRVYRDWLDRSAPTLPARFEIGALANFAPPLARRSAARWLGQAGVPPDDIGPAAIDRLIEMARDAASPARADFPGAINVRRRGGMIWVESSSTTSCARR